MRHTEPAVRGYAATHPPGAWRMPAAGGWHQLLLAGRGTLHVRTPVGAWVAPRDRAIFIPDGASPQVTLAGRVAVRALYLAADRFPWPEARPRAVCDALVADPSRPLEEVAAAAGLSRRTLERTLRAGTGLSPAAWMRRARMSASLALLAEGRPVTEVALAVGHATPSAFTAAFGREVGRPPSDYAERAAGSQMP